MTAPHPIPLSVSDALHDLLSADNRLREMIENRTRESVEMAAVERRWNKNMERRA